MQVGRLLDKDQIQVFMHRACAIANERPLSARSFGVSDFLAVTPRDLLLGASPLLAKGEDWQVGTEEDMEARLDERVAMVERKVQKWWNVYSQDVFPLLVPFRKWKDSAAALDFGAIVLVQYKQKFARDRWRLGRVLQLLPGRDGLVRSVEVGLRDMRRGVREPALQARAGLRVVTLPVQRLAVVLPGAEQPPEILRELAQKLAPAPHQAPLQPQVTPNELRVQVQQGEEEMLDLNAVGTWKPRVPQPGSS